MAFTEVSHYRVLANYLGSRENTDFIFFFFSIHGEYFGFVPRETI